MALQDSINAALLEYIRFWGVNDANEVTSFEDRTASDGYCETCWYEYAVVDIHYKTFSGKSDVYTYSGSFADLIANL